MTIGVGPGIDVAGDATAPAASGVEPDARPAGRLARFVPRRLLRQLGSFGLIGVASTLAYYAIYVVLRDPLGAQAANFVALLLTAVANTAANRRLTFGVRGSKDALRHQLGGLVAFAIALGLTSGTLWALHTLWPSPARWIELALLFAANAASTLLRFVALRVMLHRA
jgi:putative flippase GtrA